MKRLIFGILALALTGAPGAALAASQILGLVATQDATPMQCENGECTALLSAFCLQEKRLPPDFETAYVPAAAGSVTLIVTEADGTVRRMDANGLVEFHSGYGFTALRADIALDRLGAIAPVSVSLAVAPRAAMLPEPLPGDPDPLGQEEIALATGPLRIAAEAVMEGDSEPARAARVTAGLVNALPVDGDIPAASRRELWDRLAGADAPPLARRTFEACARTVDQSVGYPLRLCLEERHETLQIENTHEYWESLGGS